MNKNDNNNLISAEESNLPESGRELSSGFNASDSISSPRACDNNTAFSATEDVSPVAFSGTQKNSDCSGKKFSRQEFIADSLVARAKEYNLVGELVKNADVFGIKDTLVAKAVEYGIEEEIAANTKEYKIEEIVRAVAKEYSIDGVVKARTKEFDLTEKLLARAKEFGISEEVIARTLEYKIPSEIVARAKEFNLPEEIVARMTEIALLDSDLKASALLSDSSASISEEVPEENIIPEENDDDFDEDVEEPAEEKREEDLQADFPKTPIDQRLLDAYADTVKTADELLARHDIYTEILTVLAEGSGKAHLSERLMLRSVDEIWVKAIEECINSLDELIRNPNHYIAETEEVLPIEKTKRISGRSVAHLCRHTDYITVNDKNEISPLKMLNVFREDSLLTYENKFLNTLINRLYMFVNKRYKVAKDYGVDEKNECFEYENTFVHGEGKGKIKISVEYSERNLSGGVKNKLLGTGLWARVEKLNSIVTGYINSPFAVAMERNFVHPPILRTNAIIKNKYFRECLALWEFIESYDDAGYGITVEESAREMSDEYVREIYAGAAMQYLLFRHNMELGAVEETQVSKVIPSYNLEKVKISSYSEEFKAEEEEPITPENELLSAIIVALKADEVVSENEEKEEENDGLVKSFEAKIRLAKDEIKGYFVEIHNALIGLEGVEAKNSKRFANFYANGKPVARVSVGERSIILYAAVSPSLLGVESGAKDVSEKKGFASTPCAIVVQGQKSLALAKNAIGILAETNGLKANDNAEFVSSDYYAAESIEEMTAKGWIYSDSVSESDAGEISFGSERSENVEKMANIVSEASVKESIPADKLASMEAETKIPVSVPVRKRTAADDLDRIVRSESNYAKPTEYGIDDSSGFLNADD